MDKASIIILVALLASVLAYFGINVPADIQEYIVGAIMLILVGYGFWKNNYLASKGKKQKEVLEKHDLK